MEAGERITMAEDRITRVETRHAELDAKVERLLAELEEIRKTSGRIKEIKISDKGEGIDMGPFPRAERERLTKAGYKGKDK